MSKYPEFRVVAPVNPPQETFGEGVIVHRDSKGHILCVEYREKYRLVAIHWDPATGDITRTLKSNKTGRKVEYGPYAIKEL